MSSASIWCVLVCGVTKEVHVLEGLVPQAFEGVGNCRGIDGSKVVTHVVGVEHARSRHLVMARLSLVGDGIDGAANASR